LLTKANSQSLLRYIKKRFVPKYAFYEGLLSIRKTEPYAQPFIWIKNCQTAHRKDIVNDFIPKIEAFEKRLVLIYVFPECLTSGR
jgi:hypothetical protein